MENNKFKILDESLKALKKGSINLLSIRGEPGTGKSRTILNFLKGENVNYNYFSSYTTPLYFYKLLYENKDKEILVFDDIEGISDLKIIAMLKSLCWSPENKEREICYFSSSDKMGDYGIPTRFNTNARIILIFNNNLYGFEAVLNRGINLDFNFTFEEKIRLFEEMKEKASIEEEVLNWIKNNCDQGTENLNLRSLVILSTLKRDGFDFSLFAHEILKQDEEIKAFTELTLKCQSATSVTEQCEEWMKMTGKSRRSFYRLKKKLNL